MNRSGVTFFLTLMIGICVVLLALAFGPAIKQFNDDARNTTTADGAPGLDCSNSSISDFDNAACIGNDIMVYSFLGLLIAVGLAIMVGKVMVG